MSKTKAKSATAIEKAQSSTGLITQASQQVNLALSELAHVISTTDDPGALAAIHTTLNRDWSKVIEDQKKVIREMLLGLLDAEGSVDGLNRFAKTEYEGTRYELKKQVARSKLPDDSKFREMLEAKGLDVDQFFKPVITHELDSTAISTALDGGLLTEAEVDACRKVTSTQLKVEKI